MPAITETAIMIVMTLNGSLAEEAKVSNVPLETCLTAREEFMKAEELKLDLPKNIKIECYVNKI